MSYEIKTIYQAITPGFESLGLIHQGLYWERETAERMLTQDGGSRQGRVDEHDVIVMDNGDVIKTTSLEDPDTGTMKTTAKVVRIYGNTDEEMREATIARLPELWKKLLGLPYDKEVASFQKTSWASASDEQMRRKLLILDVTAEDARVLGMGDERTKAIEDFQEIMRLDKEQEEIRRNHPLVGQTFYLSVQRKDATYPSEVEFTVREMVRHDATGDVELRCYIDGYTSWDFKNEDQEKVLRESEVRAAMAGEKQEVPA